MGNEPAIENFRVAPATERDVPLLLTLIRELADYEKMTDKVVATEELLRTNLFGDGRRNAEAHIGYLDQRAVSYTVFFYNFSTFLCRPGLYIEDIFVRPEARGKVIGTAMFQYLLDLARQRGCGRMEWSVLNWNESAIGFYKKMGAAPQDGWTVFRLVLNPEAS